MRAISIDREVFARAAENRAPNGGTGIGTLGEKTLHACLKRYFAHPEGAFEVPVGRYVADVLKKDEVIEIQTGGCAVLAPKLRALLKEYRVTLVLPVMRQKRLCWIDPETGEATKSRKSPKVGQIGDVLPELLYLDEFLDHPRFTLLIFLYDGCEYRLRDGWGTEGKRGAHRAERIPERPVGLWALDASADLGALLPEGLSERFTAREFSKRARFQGIRLWAALKLLVAHKILTRKKEGRSYLYSVLEGENTCTNVKES